MHAILMLLAALVWVNNDDALQGAWQTQENGIVTTWIITDDFFSVSEYRVEPEAAFVSTRGGSWGYTSPTNIAVNWEFHTADPDKVGTSEVLPLLLANTMATIDEVNYERVDDGSPGDLSGAWLITGRMRDGEMRERTPGPRKTMKILSGTRFQWIAYNTETAAFSGTGGGTYTTGNGKYTENIEFFSRDASRVGASLEFDFELKDGKWHHSGNSSKGDPIYEVWTLRREL